MIKSKEFEGLAKELTSGMASEDEAQSVAFTVIAYASLLAGTFDISLLPSMNRKEALDTYDRIVSGREYMDRVTPMFNKYPAIESVLKSLSRVMFFSESTLGPFYAIANGDQLAKGAQPTKTYIIKNPATKLVKIGRSADVKSRVKALQGAAGVELVVVIVLDGDRELELHRRFSKLRQHGEWFNDKDGEISKFANAEADGGDL